MWVIDLKKEHQIVSGKRVLKADEFLATRSSLQLIRDAEAIGVRVIEEAEAKAKGIVEKANEEAKALQDSTQAAHDAEKQKGYDAGIAEGKKEMMVQMMELTAKNVQNFSNFEDAILNIVMRSLRRIIGELPSEERARRIVTTALQVIRNQKHAVLKVNPDQAPTTRAVIAELTKNNSAERVIEVVADKRLKVNDCLIETEIGIVDASLDVQLEAIKKVLEKTLVS